jgi:hypothetical protein
MPEGSLWKNARTLHDDGRTGVIVGDDDCGLHRTLTIQVEKKALSIVTLTLNSWGKDTGESGWKWEFNPGQFGYILDTDHERSPLNMVNSIRLESPCGSVFEVTAEPIWADFRALLKKHHGLDDDEADEMLARRQKEEPDHWVQWLKDQFSWDEIDAIATVVSRPSGEQLKMLCDQYRSFVGSSPSESIRQGET